MSEISTKRTFPYAFARVSAMKAKLISKDSYNRLLKMDLNSIIKFLQESEYKHSITKLAAKYSGIELIDRALRKNQTLIFEKIRRICPNDVSVVIDFYLGRYDFQNLKVILRGIFSNTPKEEVLALLEPVGKYNKKYFENLFDLGSITKILKETKLVSEKEFKSEIDEFRKTNKIMIIENKLDKVYNLNAINGSSQIPDHGIVFKDFLLRDIDILNIRNLLRFVNEGVIADDIFDHMIIQGLRLNEKTLKKLSKMENIDALYSKLKNTYYGKHINFEGDIMNVELELNKFHMKNAHIKSNKSPLSIISILNYVVRKSIEIRNLRSIVKSKHLGIDMGFVEKNLLVVY